MKLQGTDKQHPVQANELEHKVSPVQSLFLFTDKVNFACMRFHLIPII